MSAKYLVLDTDDGFPNQIIDTYNGNSTILTVTDDVDVYEIVAKLNFVEDVKTSMEQHCISDSDDFC